jgi:hypothetical protein
MHHSCLRNNGLIRIVQKWQNAFQNNCKYYKHCFIKNLMLADNYEVNNLYLINKSECVSVCLYVCMFKINSLTP